MSAPRDGSPRAADLPALGETSPGAALSRPKAAVVWIVWLIGVVAVLLSLPTTWWSAYGDVLTIVTGFTGSLAAISLATVGAILATRLPGNRVGWLLWAGGSVLGLAFAASSPPPSGAPNAVWLALLSNVLWVPAMVSVGLFVPLFFPTGHLPSRRWRSIVILVIGAVVVEMLKSLFSPFDPGGSPGVENPLALKGTAATVISLLDPAATVAGVICFPAVVASLVVRYRGASGVERAQLRWFAVAGALVGLSFAVAISAGSGAGGGILGAISNIGWELTFVGLVLMPVAIGIAITRYRLYDIDLIIRRTAVYVPLTAALAGIYAASIASLQRLFIAATGTPSDGAVILSTLVLAATFTPIKNALQAFVDRRFRDALDTERRLQRFVDAVAGGLAKPDPLRIMRGFLAVAVEASGAAGGAAYLANGDDARLVGASGAAFERPALTIPVAVAGVRLGRIDLDARRGGRPYREHEIGTLRGAGVRVAAAALSLDEPRSEPETMRLAPHTVAEDPLI